MTNSVLTVNNVCLNYGDFRALDQISFELQKGECLAVIGANGAGKTSLFDVLSGYQMFSSGEIKLQGQTINKLSMQRRFHLGLFRLDQKGRLFPKMTALENLQCATFWRDTQVGRYSFWRAMADFSYSADHARHTLKQLGMEEYADTPAENLSYATQKMLAFGMALVGWSQVWLLDEPTAGLSENQTQQIVGWIKSRRSEQSVLLIDHDLSVIFAVADRILVLGQGRVIACDTPQNIRANTAVQQSYLNMEQAC